MNENSTPKENCPLCNGTGEFDPGPLTAMEVTMRERQQHADEQIVRYQTEIMELREERADLRWALIWEPRA